MNFNITDSCLHDDYYNITLALTYDQLDSFCESKKAWSLTEIKLDLTIGYSMIIAGFIGMIGTVCMCITFWQRSTSSPSYLYYKAISVIELLHMVTLIEYGVIRMLHFPPSKGMCVWDQAFSFGWAIGDWVKLSVAVLTLAISMERCLAIWAPMTFAAINRRKAAYVCIVSSIMIGGVYLFTLVLYFMSLTSGYIEWFKQTFAEMQNAIGYIKIIICLILAPITLAILIGLRMKSKRMSTMTSNNMKNQENWDTVKRLCYLQLILSTSTLVDHLAWFSYRMTSLLSETADSNVHTFDEMQRVFWYKRLVDCVEVVQVLTGELLHCGKFYLYLFLNKSFRNTFLSLFRKGG